MNGLLNKIDTKVALVISVILFCTSCSSTKNVVQIENPNGETVLLSSDVNKDLYKEVQQWLGVPYKYGGNSKSGIDCSGLVVQIYNNVYSKKLYRSSSEIYEKNCKKISKGDLKEGDLLFFNTSKKKNRINHVGLYLHKDKFVHTSTKKGVIISDLKDLYYKDCFIVAGRVGDCKINCVRLQ